MPPETGVPALLLEAPPLDGVELPLSLELLHALIVRAAAVAAATMVSRERLLRYM